MEVRVEMLWILCTSLRICSHFEVVNAWEAFVSFAPFKLEVLGNNRGHYSNFGEKWCNFLRAYYELFWSLYSFKNLNTGVIIGVIIARRVYVFFVFIVSPCQVPLSQQNNIPHFCIIYNIGNISNIRENK